MTQYYLLAFTAITLTGFAQLFLKVGASRGGFDLRERRAHPMLLLGLGTLAIAMLLNVRSLSVLPLRALAFISPVAYILTPLLAGLFLGEKLSRNVVLGTVVVIVGMIVFNLRLFFLY